MGGAGAEEWLSPIIHNRFDLSESTAEAISILVIVVPITYLSVVVGELVPKTLALRNPLTIILKAARWLALFDRFLSPIVVALEWSTKKILYGFFRRSKLAADTPLAPDMAEQLERLSSQHKQYVLNLVNLGTKKIRDIMVPWEQVIKIESSLTATEVDSIVLSSRHTRIPVVKDDTIVGVSGLLHTKEFNTLRKTGKEDWQVIIRPVLQFQETDSLLKVLRTMQEKRSHMAIVVSQSQLIGIVTLEGIIEEIVGDLYDEDDDGALRKLLSTGARKFS